MKRFAGLLLICLVGLVLFPFGWLGTEWSGWCTYCAEFEERPQIYTDEHGLKF